MKTFVALLRGINIGGNRKLPMKDLTKIIEDKGYSDIRTYIQTGNVLFKCKSASKFESEIGQAVADQFGFTPAIMVLDLTQVESAIKNNPFPIENPKALHLYFLAKAPKEPDLMGLNKLKTDSESFKLVGDIFYLYTPDGFHNSKLASKAEKLLGVSATARNWNSVTKLREMSRKG